jgi:AcrR family transcriptional regulator
LTAATGTSRPVRKDAARNRALLLHAADELFAARGGEVTLDDIARHAGVGVATAYRHFENKSALLDALFEARIGLILQHLQRAQELDDPRESFEALLFGLAEIQAGDRGIREVLAADRGSDKITKLRAAIRPAVVRIVERAKSAGILRPEVEPTDVSMVLLMLAAVSDYTAVAGPDYWRRYFEFILDGMLASHADRGRIGVPALNAAQFDQAMHSLYSAR